MLVITGFCCVDTQVAGPDQANVPLPLANNCTVEPSHVCVNCGVAVSDGGVLIVILIADVAVHPLGLVTVSIYMPLWIELTFSITGSFDVEVKPFGPVHAYDPAPEA